MNRYVMHLRTLCFIALTLGLLTCRSEEEILLEPKPTGLKDAAPFPIGAGVEPYRLETEPVYRRTVLTEYNSLTSENRLKMNMIRPEENRYDWWGGDELVKYAGENKMRLFGHTLIWHLALPRWLETYQGDSQAWERLFRDHIQTVVRRYAGKIVAWDVVNEAFDNDGTLRKSIWLEKLGPGYVSRAFQYAREADPNARLFYNDFGQEDHPKKVQAILDMVADFRRRGIPIDGLGLQFHTDLNQQNSKLETALRELTKTGLQIHISELDVRINPDSKPNFVPTAALLLEQKARYAAIVRMYRTIVPPAQQYGITLWNVGDADTWLRFFCECKEYPLPFNDQYERKPAYEGILEELQR